MEQILKELNEIHRCFEADIQAMETSTGQKTLPVSVINNTCSRTLINSFNIMYYDLAAFDDIHSFSLYYTNKVYFIFHYYHYLDISLIPKISHSTLTITPEKNSNTFNNISLAQVSDIYRRITGIQRSFLIYTPSQKRRHWAADQFSFGDAHTRRNTSKTALEAIRHCRKQCCM